jgi:hypothetical protein
VGPPESTSKGWILLFIGGESKTGSTKGVFDRNVSLFKFKQNGFIGPMLLTIYNNTSI